ncbi:Hypothetical protein, putative [Bodo saltans]|uniref:Uncharacterized protein n=1 Tax=Bodo saltans TaxID=75058 RepID=A0A0S4ISW3_BODSA|nr:Hypothetical protein, putative [Bodo saltans]|eukprot:CUF66370.1 Hypothetical protein, putative [Bodo saltans]
MGCCGSKEKPKAQVIPASAIVRSVSVALDEEAQKVNAAERSEEAERKNRTEDELKERQELLRNYAAEAAAISDREKTSNAAQQEWERQLQLQRLAVETDEKSIRSTSYADELQQRIDINKEFDGGLRTLLETEARSRELAVEAPRGGATLEHDDVAGRSIVETEEWDVRIELEHFIQEELTVQALREKHLHDLQAAAQSPKPKRHSFSRLDRLLAPLQGHCMPPCDMPESVVRLGKMPLRQRVREEIRLTREEMVRHGTKRGTSSFLGKGHADPYAAKAKLTLETMDDNVPQRSTSVCSRGSHHDREKLFVRSASQNSAWARDTSDRWNCEDFNLNGAPRYSPRRTKARLPIDDQRRAASGCTAASKSSSQVDYERERTPGPGSHTGLVFLHNSVCS